MTDEKRKMQMVKEGEDEDFKGYAAEKLRWVKILQNMGYTTDQAIKLMIYFCLNEISDALEPDDRQKEGDYMSMRIKISYESPQELQEVLKRLGSMVLSLTGCRNAKKRHTKGHTLSLKMLTNVNVDN